MCLYAVNGSELPPVHKYEDLDVWKYAFAIVREVYDISATGAFGRDYGLKNQIQRAAVSSMSNIAEGFSRKSRKEFARYLDIARGSVYEVQSLLYVAENRQYVSKTQFKTLYQDCERLYRGVSALMRHLETTRGSR